MDTNLPAGILQRDFPAKGMVRPGWSQTPIRYQGISSAGKWRMQVVKLVFLAVAGMVVCAAPAQTHMNEKCAEALTTYSLVAAAWISTTAPGERLQADEAPEAVIAALRRVMHACIGNDRQRPRRRDGK